MELLTQEDWKVILDSLRAKKISPVTAGGDRESREWRGHLSYIIEYVENGEYDFTDEDWTEIYYALDECSQNDADALRDKIGPDGQNMWVR